MGYNSLYLPFWALDIGDMMGTVGYVMAVEYKLLIYRPILTTYTAIAF